MDDCRREFVGELGGGGGERGEACLVWWRGVAGGSGGVVGGGSLESREGRVRVESSGMLEFWREYHEKLLSGGFVWGRGGLRTLAPAGGPCAWPSAVKEVRSAVHLARSGGASGPSEVASDVLQFSGGAGVRWVTGLCNAIVRKGAIRGTGGRAGC